MGMTTLTPAQAARQAARAGNGEYAEMPGTDQGDAALTGGDAPLPPDEPLVFERVYTLQRVETDLGRRHRLDPARTAKPPALSEDDDAYTANAKMVRYLKTTGLPPTAQDVSETLGFPLIDNWDPESAGAGYALPLWIGTRDTSRLAVLDRSPGSPLVVDLDDRVAKNKQNEYRRPHMGIRNAGDLLAQRRLITEFREQFQMTDTEAETLERRLQNPRCHVKDTKWWFGTQASLGTSVQDVLGLAAGLDKPAMSATWSDPGSLEEYRRRLALWRGQVTAIASDPEHAKALLAKLPVAEDPAFAGGRVYDLTDTKRGVRGSTSVSATLSAIDADHRRTATMRAYRAFLAEQMQRETDRSADIAFIDRQAGDHSATVYEQKKHIPKTHLEYAERTRFRDSFSHVEVDESANLGEVAKVEEEWARMRPHLPATRPPVLRFRLTGRHHAAGIYHPGYDNIAVDPRHPDSFWHEYVHHLDFTSGEHNLSSDERFRPVLRAAQDALKGNSPSGRDSSHSAAPTEIHSRAAELYLYWKGVETSLNGDAAAFTGQEYRSLEPLRPQITAWFDALFAEHGVTL